MIGRPTLKQSLLHGISQLSQKCGQRYAERQSIFSFKEKIWHIKYRQVMDADWIKWAPWLKILVPIPQLFPHSAPSSLSIEDEILYRENLIM